MQTSKIEINELKELLTYKIKHTFLDKYIEEPVIDEGKLMTLSMIVNDTSLPINIKKQYIVTTMLVQAALDTHDLVPVTNEEDADAAAIVTRQLTVLAGDYYSGLYYLLLAEIKDIDLIHMLATTIKEISEYKMKLYYQEVDSFDQYIHLMANIESLLILRVAEFVEVQVDHEVMKQLMIVNKLIQEKQNFSRQNSSSILKHWLLNNGDDSQDFILDKVESIIKENTKAIELFLTQKPLDTSVSKTQIQEMLNQLNDNYKAVVEEG